MATSVVSPMTSLRQRRSATGKGMDATMDGMATVLATSGGEPPTIVGEVEGVETTTAATLRARERNRFVSASKEAIAPSATSAGSSMWDRHPASRDPTPTREAVVAEGAEVAIGPRRPGALLNVGISSAARAPVLHAASATTRCLQRGSKSQVKGTPTRVLRGGSLRKRRGA